MPTLAPDALPARLAGEPLRPAYLIAGAETLLVLEAADAVRAAAREQGCSERETFEADARGFDWNAFAAHVNAPSLQLLNVLIHCGNIIHLQPDSFEERFIPEPQHTPKPVRTQIF